MMPLTLANLVLVGVLLTPPAGIVQEPASPSAQEPASPSVAQQRFIAALRLVEQQRLDEALAEALAGEVLAPDDADGVNLLGKIYEMLDRPGEAAEAYQRAASADPGWAPPVLNLGLLHLRAGQWDLAVAELSRAAALAPDEARTQALLGVAFRNLGQPADARDAFERAWRLDPENGQIAVDVAVSRRAAGDTTGALTAAEQAVDLRPDDPMPLSVLGRLLSQGATLAEVTRAPSVFRRAIALAPDDPGLWTSLAAAYAEMALRNDAEDALRRAIALGDDSPEAHLRLGQTLARQSKWGPALAEYDVTVASRPDRAVAHQYRGEALFNLNRPDEALAAFQQAMSLAPGAVNAIASAVQILFVKGDLDGVAAALATARPEDASDQLRVDLETARLHSRRGDDAAALATLERVLAADPTSVDGLYLKGQSLLKLGRAEEGRATLAQYQIHFAAERGEEVESLRIGLVDRAQVYVLRSRVYIAEGRHDEALEQLEAAVELAPDTVEAWALLVDVHELLGNPEAAAAARERVGALR